MSDTINILCLACGEPSYLTDEVAQVTEECPHCGDRGVPADLDEIVTVAITAHELRVLTFWAASYARMYDRAGWDTDGRMARIMKTIVDRLSMQTDTPLSLGHEIANMRSGFFEKFASNIDLLVIDQTGRCLECGQSLPTDDEDAMFAHSCGVLDEPPAAEEEDTPPYSS